MTTAEKLEILRRLAREDAALRKQLLSTRQSEDALEDFCRISSENGVDLSPIDIVMYGEESYAAMRRSTNGGGENSPLLEWEDDYYELFMAELEHIHR